MAAIPSCPRCGYDLTGVAASWRESCPLEGTCSECGLVYQWRHVFDPLAGVPRWSIEHAPRWVMLRLPGATLRAILSPWLWRRLRMSHPIRLGRLLTLATVALLIPHILTSLYVAWTSFAMHTHNTSVWYGAHVLPPAAALFWPFSPLYGWMVSPDLWAVAALFFTIPLAFLLLPQTFAALRIRRLHLVRITVYSFMPLVLWLPWVAVLRGVGVFGEYWLFQFFYPYRRSGRRWISVWLDTAGDAAIAGTHWIVLIAAIWLTFYWWSAARFYLKLPTPLRVVLGTGCVGALAAFALAAACTGGGMLQDVGTALFGFQP